MTLQRMLLVLVALAAVVGAAIVGQETEPVGAKMAAAAEKFLASLDAEQKGQAQIAFDSNERFNYHFVPLQDKEKKPTRKGLRLELMKPEQKKAALELVRVGTSDSGYTKATTIMSLESILHELEKGGTNVRSPEWYFFSIFGTPSRTGKWGWRVEGHHLSLNFTIDRGKVISATPAFFGANPATVMAGPRKGLRTLPEAEDYAKELFASLDEGQQKAARQQKQFPEIEQGRARATVGAPVGLAAAKMNDKQRETLMKLIEGYATRLRLEIAAAELSALKAAGIEKIHFAFAREDDKPGKPYTYRVQGPTFLIEFLNVQPDSARNPANHIHSCWRNTQGDFGLATP